MQEGIEGTQDGWVDQGHPKPGRVRGGALKCHSQLTINRNAFPFASQILSISWHPPPEGAFSRSVQIDSSLFHAAQTDAGGQAGAASWREKRGGVQHRLRLGRGARKSPHYFAFRFGERLVNEHAQRSRGGTWGAGRLATAARPVCFELQESRRRRSKPQTSGSILNLCCCRPYVTGVAKLQRMNLFDMRAALGNRLDELLVASH